MYTIQAGDKAAKIASSCATTWDFLGRINTSRSARGSAAGPVDQDDQGPVSTRS
jgi:hypothetical protein